MGGEISHDFPHRANYDVGPVHLNVVPGTIDDLYSPADGPGRHVAAQLLVCVAHGRSLRSIEFQGGQILGGRRIARTEHDQLAIAQ